MNVEQIWRYPAKSMAGEQLASAMLTPLGIDGERVVHVEDAHGRFITSRTHSRLLGHSHSLIRPVNHSLTESYGVSPKYVNSWSTLLVLVLAWFAMRRKDGSMFFHTNGDRWRDCGLWVRWTQTKAEHSHRRGQGIS